MKLQRALLAASMALILYVAPVTAYEQCGDQQDCQAAAVYDYNVVDDPYTILDAWGDYWGDYWQEVYDNGYQEAVQEAWPECGC